MSSERYDHDLISSRQIRGTHFAVRRIYVYDQNAINLGQGRENGMVLNKLFFPRQGEQIEQLQNCTGSSEGLTNPCFARELKPSAKVNPLSPTAVWILSVPTLAKVICPGTNGSFPSGTK